jgi:hypothetical protein
MEVEEGDAFFSTIGINGVVMWMELLDLVVV